MTPNDKYSVSKSECLRQPIKMQLSKNRNIFSQFFSAFAKFRSNLEYFKKKMSQRGYLLLKLQTAKSGVTQMPKKRSARTLVDSQRVKGSETLLKSEQQYFSHVFWSLWKRKNSKNSFLVVSIVLRHFVDIFTPDDKYSLSVKSSV